MKKIKLLLIVFLMPFGAFAWDGNGHMTAGAIAYYYLKDNNAAVLKKVLATLKLHPWYQQARWKRNLAKLVPDDPNAALFMLASTYPDDAKTIPKFADGDSTHKKWHYIDYPFVAPGFSTKPKPPKGPDDAQSKLTELMNSLPVAANSADKAVSLAWLFHLIEDIHQPLHTAQIFDSFNPRGDHGGLRTFIKIDKGSGKGLHGVWDGLVEGNLKTYASNAKALLKMEKYKDNNLPELLTNPKFEDWILKESFPAAKQLAYLNGTVTGNSSHPSTVSLDYLKDARSFGEKQVVLSGIRLARLLTTIYHA